MSTFPERLKGLIETSGVGVRELSRKIGVSHPSIYGGLTGKGQPSTENIERLADFFLVTPAFLRYGEPGTDGPQSLIMDDDTISIPVLDIHGSCGFEGNLSPVVTLVKMLRVAREWLTGRMPTWANLRFLHIITADGDSMSPEIKSGDFVIIDSSKTSIGADAVYAIQYGGSIFIKRVQMHPDGSALLISDNPKYQPIAVQDPATLRVVGRCVLSFNVREM